MIVAVDGGRRVVEQIVDVVVVDLDAANEDGVDVVLVDVDELAVGLVEAVHARHYDLVAMSRGGRCC